MDTVEAGAPVSSQLEQAFQIDDSDDVDDIIARSDNDDDNL